MWVRPVNTQPWGDAKVKKISFSTFTQSMVERETKLTSLNLKLKEIEPFEHNVRLDYDTEELERLKQSIQENWNIWNIDVFHIIQGNRYVISDGHRTHRAYTELYWPEYEVEVFVREEYPEYNKDVELRLMTIWFVTSNTKSNLKFHEELESIKKFLQMLDTRYPDEPPHLITQKEVYEALGMKKSKAMKMWNILEKFSPDQFDLFKEEELSFNLLQKIAQIKDQWVLELVLEIIQKKWVIQSSTDVSDVLNSISQAKNLSETKTVPTTQKEKEDFIEEVTEKLEAKRESQWKAPAKIVEVENEVTEEDKLLHAISLGTAKITKSLLNINPDKLTDEQKRGLKELFNNIKTLFKNKNL